MAGSASAGELREETLLAGYFFYGEEEYLAEEFMAELKKVLATPEGGELPLTRMELGETSWRDVIDAARTAPFLFESWRAIVVRFPERRSGAEKGGARPAGAAEEAAPESRLLSATDQRILRDYFASPSSRTVLVVLRPGRVRRDDAAVRFFSSLPKAAIAATEMKPLGFGPLMRRADDRARSLGKTLTEGAKRRLFEIVGQDLRLVLKEIEKLAVYVGEKKGIDEDDVSQATAWQRSFQAYELDDALAAGDFSRAAAILNALFAEGERPEQVIGRLSGFLRNILAAQSWLREGGRTREAIFREFFPKISKNFVDLWTRKYEEFFGAVDGIGPAELNALIRKLRDVDVLIKTTDASPRTALEIFLREYCLARRRKGPISGRRA